MQNAQGAGWGRALEAIGLREKVCFHVLFESLHGRGTAEVGGELVPQSGGEKALSPNVLSLVQGIASWSLSDDLRDRRGV